MLNTGVHLFLTGTASCSLLYISEAHNSESVHYLYRVRRCWVVATELCQFPVACGLATSGGRSIPDKALWSLGPGISHIQCASLAHVQRL